MLTLALLMFLNPEEKRLLKVFVGIEPKLKISSAKTARNKSFSHGNSISNSKDLKSVLLKEYYIIDLSFNLTIVCSKDQLYKIIGTEVLKNDII